MKRPLVAAESHVLLIDLPESVDDEAVRTLGTELRELVGSSPAREVRLNASALREVSTRGLGLLCSLQLIAVRYGKRLVVEGCTPALRPRLALVQLSLSAAEADDVPLASGTDG